MRSGDVVRILRGEHPQRLEHLGPRADEPELEMVERGDGASSDVFRLHLGLFEGRGHGRRQVRGRAEFGLRTRRSRIPVIPTDFQNPSRLALILRPGIRPRVDGRCVAAVVPIVVEFGVVGFGLGFPFVASTFALLPDPDGVGRLLLGELDDTGPFRQSCGGIRRGFGGGEPPRNLLAHGVVESVSAGADPVAGRDSAESFSGLREVACESLECACGCGDGAGIPEDELFRVVRLSQFFLVGHGAHRIRDVISEVLDFDRDLLEPYCTKTLADEIGGTVDESADEFPSALEDA
ncbi:hypothetical protein R4144_21660 [Gordonia amicalis]|nr:hypothetical protein [Gordonia amicalis]MDV7175912.1 hypothetical protein [Gordonia amicalis]